jgi:diacylglycerol kinase family enzyme
MFPAIDARPDDGLLDLYLLKPVPGLSLLRMASDYVQGRYAKWPQAITHHRGKRIAVSSDQYMPICLDGEYFINAAIEYEAIPRSILFAGPPGFFPEPNHD